MMMVMTDGYDDGDGNDDDDGDNGNDVDNVSGTGTLHRTQHSSLSQQLS